MKLPSWEGSFLEECSGRRDCKGELGLEQKDFIYGGIWTSYKGAHKDFHLVG